MLILILNDFHCQLFLNQQGGVSERPSSLARPYQSPRISEDELASHNLDAKDEDGYQIRRRLTRPVRPAYDQETDQEEDE